jgi:hypothetical protein
VKSRQTARIARALSNAHFPKNPGVSSVYLLRDFYRKLVRKELQISKLKNLR